MQKITPFLWYETDDAINVARYYQSVFGNENVEINNEKSFSDTPSGDVQVVSINLFGTAFTLMSAGPHATFNDAVSFVVNCDNQEEIDRLWNTLISDGGEESMCGWCRDKYGVRWQIIPHNINELTASQSAMQAMLKMKKIVIADLTAAS